MNERLLDNALTLASRLGAAEAEIALAREVNLEIEAAQGKLETLASAESIGMGVRVFTQDRRVGFAYTTALDGGIERAVENACENAANNEPDEHNVLPEEDAKSDDDWAEEDLSAIPVAEKIGFCRELEARTLAADKRVTHVQQASYGDVRHEWTLANSHGLRRTFRTAYCTCQVIAAAAEPGSDSEMGWEFDFARRFAALRGDWVAQHCAERATRALGAKPCATRAMPIVLDDYVATEILSVVSPALMANNVLKGKSLFAGRIGEAIASSCITIVDQNDLDIGMNRAPFDGEGSSAQRTALVEAGILRGFLHNAYTAHKMGCRSTANAGRGGFRSTPEAGATNCFLAPGKSSLDDLLLAADDGLFITEAIGVHTADPISGDFSFGVAGLRIEHGQFGPPVRGVTIAGNIKDLLGNIQACGADLRFFGSFGAPPLLISGLVVSGE